MKIYKNISTLYTFKGFAKKMGRNPVDQDFRPIKKAAMIVGKNGLIEWVGKEESLLAQVQKKGGLLGARVIDLEGLNVFPSFTESHTHLVFAGNRKKEFDLKIKGATYQQIAKMGGGISSTVRETKKASFEELLASSRLRIKRFKEQGVGLVEVKSGYGGDFKTEKKILEVAFSLKGIDVKPTYLALHAIPKKVEKEEYVNRVINIDLPKMKKKFPKLSRADLFIERGYFSKQDLKRFKAQAENLNLDLCAHVDQLSGLSGAITAAHLGALSVEHAVFLKPQEIRSLAKTETVINLLPGADFYLKTKYPEARKLIDAGCRVSIATDFNPGSSPTQDLSFIGVLARREMKMSLAEVWCAYTLNASLALGVKNKGSLQKGYKASFFTTKAKAEDFFYEVGNHPVEKLYS